MTKREVDASANLHRVWGNEDDSEWDGESTKKNER